MNIIEVHKEFWICYAVCEVLEGRIIFYVCSINVPLTLCTRERNLHVKTCAIRLYMRPNPF
jgi:hypothetical protein